MGTVGNRSTRSCATPWPNTKSGTSVVTWQYHNRGYSWSEAEGKAERKLEHHRQRCYAQARQEVLTEKAERKKRKRKSPSVALRVRTCRHEKEIATIVGILTVRTARDVTRSSPGRMDTRSFSKRRRLVEAAYTGSRTGQLQTGKGKKKPV